jgi:RNA polymerase sigma factor (sigma-70 family)
MSGVMRQVRRLAVLPDGGGMTDAQLLEGFLARRDDAAFEALVRRHGPMVLGVCRRLLRHAQDAEDAFQAAFLVLARRAAAVRPQEMLANWLYGVAYRTALKARAAAARRRTRERQVRDMPEPEAPATEAWGDLGPLLDRELERLPERYRVAVVLCDLEGRTRREAARQLGWPEGTLSTRLTRGRARLARRLARHGLALSAGALVVLLRRNAAPACVPAPLLVSTVQAAAVVAAGQAAAGVVSPAVAALTEGVVKPMLMSKVKVAVLALLVVGPLATGGSVLTYRALAAAPPAGQLDAQAAGARNPDGTTPVLTGPVVAVSKDGQVVTVETAPPTSRTGDEPKRSDIRITDKTEVTYSGVGLSGAAPSVGYHAEVSLQQGSADTAARVHFTWVDALTQGQWQGMVYVAKVVGLSQDGKALTVELPPRRDQGPQNIDLKLTDQTKLTYAYVAKDGAKPMAGYRAEVWLEGRGSDTASRVHFVDPEGEKAAMVNGQVVGLSKDGSTMTLKVPPEVRGGEPRNADVKIAATTEITFNDVGPGEAKLTEGFYARVWLQEAAPDTAARIIMFKSTGRGR